MSATQKTPDTLTPLRLRLLANGYHPVPIAGPRMNCRSPGKQPLMRDWRQICATADEAEVRRWATAEPGCTNTGLLCGLTVGVDVDVPFPAVAARIEKLVVEHLGPTPLRRVGNAPKALLVYGIATALPKMETPELFTPDGIKLQVEILGAGQQFVAYGGHPDTGRDYEWPDAGPDVVPQAELPVVDEAQLRRFLAAAEAVLRAAGGETQKERDAAAREAAGGHQAQPGPEAAANRPKASGAAPSGAGGDRFFREVNRAALGSLGAWVPQIFPKARQQATGGWRVTSADFGREFEEDLSIHPDGIQDFGPRVGLSPIDVTMEFGGASTPQEAAFALCEWIGRTPADFGWKASHPHDSREAPRPERDNAPDLAAQPFVWKPPKEIPPREWLLGTTAIRGFISVLVAPGGVGKSSLAVLICLAVATGRALLNEHVFERTAAWLLNLEDPREEMERRITAAMIHHRIPPEEVDGRLFLNSGRDRRVVMASLPSRHDGQSSSIAYPDKAQIIAEAKQRKIGVLVVDPFINSHELDENSNPHMNAAARAWAEVASDAKCAVILVHHTRKGAAGAGDAEGSRGAKALVDAARVTLTMTAMTPEEAGLCGVPLAERWRHVRLDDAKQNMAPRADKARWLRLASVPLGNSSDTYPNGDSVQAVETWNAPGIFGNTSSAALNAVLDMIDQGMDDGRRWGDSRRGNSDRWVGHLLMRELNRTQEQASTMIAAWLKSGLLVREAIRNSGKGRDEINLRVDHTKRPGVQCEP